VFSWISGQSQNDGVHRVAAGGSSKNRKPAGRNSGATLCYVALFFVVEFHHVVFVSDARATRQRG